MKKYQIVLVSVFSAVMLLWFIGRVTNAFKYYSVPTKSNEPTYKTGSHFLASNLKTPKRLDFICYKTTVPEYNKETWFHRVCGLPGDIVEIRNGDLFVNGISQDEPLNLKKLYVVPFTLITDLDFEAGEMVPVGKDSVMVPLETIKQKDLIKKARLYIDNREDPAIKGIYGRSWSPYNFGPYTVPANSYFVLGDNRYAAMDSRYGGPIEKKNYITTILR
jgi:signal peptidase I